MRTLFASIAACAVLTVTPAVAESTTDAMKSFGLIGSWSPNCAGSVRVVFAAPTFGAPTMIAGQQGREDVITEIQEAEQLPDQEIRVTSIIKKAPAGHAAQPGETWETVYEKVGGRLRAILSKQKDGSKVSAVDGVQYVPARQPDGTTTWKNSGNETFPFEKCLN